MIADTPPRVTYANNLEDGQGNHKGAELLWDPQGPCAFLAHNFDFPHMTKVETGPLPQAEIDTCMALEKRTLPGKTFYYQEPPPGGFSKIFNQGLKPGIETVTNYTLGGFPAHVSFEGYFAHRVEAGNLHDPATGEQAGVWVSVAKADGSCKMEVASLELTAADPVTGVKGFSDFDAAYQTPPRRLDEGYVRKPAPIVFTP